MDNCFLLLVLLGATSAVAAEELSSLDGIYTESITMINEQGQETIFFPSDHAVLEFNGDQFKFWHFSDARGFTKFPITGKYTRTGENIELNSDKLSIFPKRYVATTINGVPGIWPEKELRAWRDGKYPTLVPILVRVADGPSGEELDRKSFKFPSVTPLLDKVAAKKFWAEHQKKHEARYLNVPEPLRALLRQRSTKGDGDMVGYQKMLKEYQSQPNPKLIKQLVAETGKGVSIVVGPMVLKDLFGCGSLFSDVPVFAKDDVAKRAALQTLVDAIPEAKNSYALNAILLVFLRTSGLKEIDHTCADATQVKLKAEKGRTTIKSYHFSEVVAAECKDWADERLAELFGAAE